MRKSLLSFTLIAGLFLPIGAIHAQDTNTITATCDAGHQYQPQGIRYATDLYLARAAHRLVLLMTKSTSCPAHLEQTSPAGQ